MAISDEELKEKLKPRGLDIIYVPRAEKGIEKFSERAHDLF